MNPVIAPNPLFPTIVGLLVAFLFGFVSHAVIGGALDILDRRRRQAPGRVTQSDLERANLEAQAAHDFERALRAH